MATQVMLPRLGQGMESGTIVRWLKSEGDAVDRDEALYELDTDKVTQEVEAGVSGVLLKILAGEGTEVAVGKPIAVIGESGEEVPADTDGAGTVAKEAPTEPPEAPAEPQDAPAEPVGAGPVRPAETEEPAPTPETAPARDGGRVKASPLARRMARERGIDLRRVDGTGPEGRIVAEDIERAAVAPAWEAKPVPVTDASETVKLTSIRRTIARRLSKAWEAPHFAVSTSVDMRRVVALRGTLVERTPAGRPRPTYSDVLTKLCSVALLSHRALNAHYEGDSVRIFGTANIGIAVAIENGLVVPVIHNAELRSIPELAEARVDLVERTRAGRLKPDDLEGGTFTISNLGMYGVERFFAVLNPPQVAILAVGAIEDRVVAEEGQPVVRPRMDLTLSCDHRGVDGATAAEFLRTLKELLEEPALGL